MNPTILCQWMIAKIASHPDLPNLIGDRAFPDQAPRGTQNPCLIYQVLDAQFEDDLDARNVEEGEFSIQFRAYASSRIESNQVRHLMKTLLTESGVTGDQSAGATSFRILASSVTSFDDTFEENSDEGDDYGSIFIWNVTANEVE